MLTLPEKMAFAIVLVASITYFVLRTITLVRLLRMGQAAKK